MNVNEHIKELIPQKLNSTELLSYFENQYKFSRYNNLIYFITTDLATVKSFDEKVKHKFGMSAGSFERRWTSYCHHAISTMPFITSVLTIPNMEHYWLFYPEVKIEDRPTIHNEEKKLKKLYKDRRYKAGSSECIEISLNEICDYFEKRQAEINKIYDEYCLDYKMWRLPFIDEDGNHHDRIKYHYKLREERIDLEIKEETRKEFIGKNKFRKWGEKINLDTWVDK